MATRSRFALLATVGPLAFLCVLAASRTPAAAPLSVAASTGAAQTDQTQPLYSGGLSLRGHATQTLSAGRSGLLTRVDLPFCSTTSGAVIQLKVSSVDNPSIAATSAFSFTSTYSDCAWYTFTFSQPESVSAGEQLQLALSTQKGNQPLWGSSPYPGNPYPGGAGKWKGLTINDFAFRTYVQ